MGSVSGTEASRERRRSMARERRRSKKKAKGESYVKQRIWQLGMILIVLGSFADFGALAFAAQSVIAPLGSLNLVCNAFLAPIILKVRLWLYMYAQIALYCILFIHVRGCGSVCVHTGEVNSS